MKNNFSAILYINIAVVIIAGVSLFIMKDSILEAVRQQTGVNSAAQITIISETLPIIASSSALDTSVLKLPRFTALVNNVNNFNFDNICWRPDAVTSQVIAPRKIYGIGEEATSTEAVAAVCVQGNSAPFLVTSKEK